jgi:hypothetical protein
MIKSGGICLAKKYLRVLSIRKACASTMVALKAYLVHLEKTVSYLF